MKNDILRNDYLQNDTDVYSSLRDFFHQKDPVLSKNLKAKVDKLINLVFQKNVNFSELYLFIESEKNKEVLLGIAKELCSIISNEISICENKNSKSEYSCLQVFSLKKLKEIEKEFPGFPICMAPLSLSVSCHIGPGALALACSKKVPELDA